MKKPINVIWSGPHKPNWGDELNKTLVNYLSGSEVHYGTHVDKHYLCIGSILRLANKNSIVWGSGFIKENEKAEGEGLFLAVRGPLSRNKLLDQGFSCPQIYGDPALLLPRFYNPPITKKYKLGIIPHYIDQDNEWLDQFKDNPSVNIINILNPNVLEFVDEIKKCEVILSSSLHGIICGDAYGIPSYWIELSDKVIGEGFKFRDYFLSVKRSKRSNYYINISTFKLNKTKFYDYKIDIDLDLLYQSCPFLKTNKVLNI
jgi:pyruvyltransferase|tara:strand:+ start:3240 stop:4016 length:777 start_codon:yes stop_codon:yes gene_type:complete